ncbi:DNA cytosine methyltransferase [Frankia sp. Cj3]|uniref:DNA cytosine methyltransferase n=2 Tax=unclassified Frankia TaxID=2632575 RepID=UPI001EF52912|nr:DNA cytosine methyltransferase [Frankia sp. Cj3]
MNVLSLFSGIGAMDRGLTRAGMTMVGQVEADPYRRTVLTRHWPGVPQHDDVRSTADWWAAAGTRPRVDVIAGSPPCEPFSDAGRHQGAADPRWGWPWMVSVVRALRPRYVVVENSAALPGYRAEFGAILADLAELGMDAQWGVLSACAMGAPHVRERLFLVAYTHSLAGAPWLGAGWPIPGRHGEAGPWADPVGFVAADARGRGVADGPARGLDAARITALGGAVVPQVAEHIGRLLMAHAGQGWAPADLSARLAAGDTVVIRLPARGVPYPPELRALADAGLLVRIGRPSRWGNPHRLPAGGTDVERADVVARYRAYLETQLDLLRQLPDLRGKALGCHCAPAACHGDVLADLANHR